MLLPKAGLCRRLGFDQRHSGLKKDVANIMHLLYVTPNWQLVLLTNYFNILPQSGLRPTAQRTQKDVLLN